MHIPTHSTYLILYVADNDTLAKRRSHHGTSNCYNIQEGRIIETSSSRRPRSRYLSPARTKNKSLCPILFQNTSTPIAASSTLSVSSNTSKSTNNNNRSATLPPQLQQPLHQSPQSTTNQTFGTSLCKKNTTAFSNKNGSTSSSGSSSCKSGISYRGEKKNPLQSTRLSCYKPKISTGGDYSLPHYKSVDDFLFFNAAELTECDTDYSCGGSDMAALIGAYHAESRKKQILPTDVRKMQTVKQEELPKNKENKEDSNIVVSVHRPQEDDSIYGFTTFKTKSIENILCDSPREVKKKPSTSSSYLSNRIRLMSNRTQKLFHRFYNPDTSSNVQVRPKSKVAECGGPNEFSNQNNAVCRRSLSYGNLPGIDEFHHSLKVIDRSNLTKTNTSNEAVELLSNKFIEGGLENTKETNCNNAEDTDSGILVNESGQSSIIETDDVATSLIKATEPLQKVQCEYKFIRLHLNEDDTDQSLKIALAPIASIDNTSIGYQVTHILPGGLVHR